MSINIIPVTRTSSPRAHADVVLTVTKHGDLNITLSPSFLEGQSHLNVGDKVLMGYDPEAKRLYLTPAGECTESLRTIRPRAAFAGAGTVVITANCLPEGLPLPDNTKRVSLEWLSGGAGDVYLSMV